jgi:lipoprotein-releasing system ATP-binding protein
MSDAMAPALKLEGVTRTYASGAGELRILTGADLEVRAGEVVGLVGPSGSGKSSLLHAAALLEAPDAGKVIIQGRDGVALPERDRTRLRRSTVGFVYQFHHLLAELDALENVALPLMIAGRAPQTARAQAGAMLQRVGLAERLTHRPAQLSGGEQQRVAIARALVHEPPVVLADEPTGDLDPATSDAVFDLLSTVCRDSGAAALIATHNHALAARMDRVVTLEAGKLVTFEPA